MKPKSIIWFDRLFWASMVFGWALIVMLWEEFFFDIALDQELVNFIMITAVAFIAIGSGIWSVLWFFVSRKASNVARWIYSIMSGLTLISYAIPDESTGTEGLIANLILASFSISAVTLLFVPASNAWFKNSRVGGPDDIKVFE